MKRLIVFLMGTLLFACVSSKDVRILDKDLDKLQSRINILQKENSSTKNGISDLRAENQNLKADLSLRLENLQSEIRTLSTSVEEYKEFLNKPSKEMDRFEDEMEGRLRTFEEKGKPEEEKFRDIEDRLKGSDRKTTGLTSKPMESERLAPTKEILAELKGVSTGMGDLYKDAYETLYKGNLEGARRKFEAFLKQYPNTELSGNALFWIGETYYQKKDFEKAILEYEKAITQYPESGKIPAALFEQALAFLELGDKTDAGGLLKKVIERFPHSDQAEMAKKKLEAIK
ncbi:MAG TPA: tol-pal system protein YbgF [Thermodesulfobacteriota bacterium]|nr:tol-pal system protein YbgF [Thermodesulfobacteriota bacterium]